MSELELLRKIETLEQIVRKLETLEGGAGVPSNTVAFYVGAAAPTGWVEYTTARGRMIVGMPNGGTLEGTVGVALTDLQDKTHSHTETHTHAGPSHTHTGPSHNHTITHTHTGPDHTHTITHTHTSTTHKHNQRTQAQNDDGVTNQWVTAANGDGSFQYIRGTGPFGGTAMLSGVTDTTPGDTGGSSAANTGSGGTGATGGSSDANTGNGGTGATGADGTGATGGASNANTGTSALSASLSYVQLLAIKKS